MTAGLYPFAVGSADQLALFGLTCQRPFSSGLR
jgi:hypothetical protein